MPPISTTYESLLRHPFMATEGLEAITAADLVAAMIAFELALAAEQETRGLVPEGTTAAIESQLSVDTFNIAQIARDTPKGGNPAIPFVQQAKAALPEELRRWFHLGATSQDVVDSALMQCVKPRMQRCLHWSDACLNAGSKLMRVHRTTPMIGRTLMQQALPITFGAKVASWLWGLAQAEERLRRVAVAGLYVQFGGPVGVHSDLGDTGLDLMDGLAQRLGLNTPMLPWHTNRQPILELASGLDAVAVACEKMALDIALLCQSEVGEVSEPAEAGVGGSSSMPHKRNPVACARIRAAACQIHGINSTLSNAAAQPLERALGEWHAEWAPMLDAILLCEGALTSLAALLSGLEVHTTRMAQNLALASSTLMVKPATRLLSEALAPARASALAAEAAEAAQTQRRDYLDVLMDAPEVRNAFDPEQLRGALGPARQTGTSAAQVDRLLMHLQKRA